MLTPQSACQASVVTLTLHSVIPGRRGSGEPGIPRLRREIPGSPFGRPGMTLSESDVGDITLAIRSRGQSPGFSLSLSLSLSPNSTPRLRVRLANKGHDARALQAGPRQYSADCEVYEVIAGSVQGLLTLIGCPSKPTLARDLITKQKPR